MNVWNSLLVMAMLCVPMAFTFHHCRRVIIQSANVDRETGYAVYCAYSLRPLLVFFKLAEVIHKIFCLLILPVIHNFFSHKNFAAYGITQNMNVVIFSIYIISV